MSAEQWAALLALGAALAYAMARLAARAGQTQAPLNLWVPARRRAPRPPIARLRRPAQDRRKEAAWIRAGLEADLDMAFMARALRGNPSRNLRRVRAVLVALQTSRQPPAGD